MNLKKKRTELLKKHPNFKVFSTMIEDQDAISKIFSNNQPEVVVHLAAQAGVRYSVENPKAYIDSNLIGTYNILECCKDNPIKHLLLASTSSVYGGNISIPFDEGQKCDTQLSRYAATKKSNEVISHS